MLRRGTEDGDGLGNFFSANSGISDASALGMRATLPGIKNRPGAGIASAFALTKHVPASQGAPEWPAATALSREAGSGQYDARGGLAATSKESCGCGGGAMILPG